MAAYNYFTLTDSAAFTRKFKVIRENYDPVKSKKSSVETTVDGDLDISIGSIQESHKYAIIIKETETEDGYGDKYDLEYFYSLNNPGGTPSMYLTMVDHYGVSHQVVLLGDMPEKPLGSVIEGEDAYFIMPIVIQFLPEHPTVVIGSGS